MLLVRKTMYIALITYKIKQGVLMFNKKVILSMTAVAMAGLIGCGDDSSSGAPASTEAPASVPTFMDIDNIPCSQTENLCAKVLTEDDGNYYQCNGTQWNIMILGQDTPVKGCENAATDPAATEPAAQDTAAATDPAVEPAVEPVVEPAVEPAAQDTAAVTEPAVAPVVEPVVEPATQDTAATEPAASASGTVACQKGPICTTGPAALAAECSADEGETLLDACPAGGEACDMGGGVTMHLYEGAGMTCAELLAFMAM